MLSAFGGRAAIAPVVLPFAVAASRLSSSRRRRTNLRGPASVTWNMPCPGGQTPKSSLKVKRLPKILLFEIDVLEFPLKMPCLGDSLFDLSDTN